MSVRMAHAYWDWEHTVTGSNVQWRYYINTQLSDTVLYYKNNMHIQYIYIYIYHTYIIHKYTHILLNGGRRAGEFCIG